MGLQYCISPGLGWEGVGTEKNNQLGLFISVPKAYILTCATWFYSILVLLPLYTVWEAL